MPLRKTYLGQERVYRNRREWRVYRSQRDAQRRLRIQKYLQSEDSVSARALISGHQRVLIGSLLGATVASQWWSILLERLPTGHLQISAAEDFGLPEQQEALKHFVGVTAILEPCGRPHSICVHRGMGTLANELVWTRSMTSSDRLRWETAVKLLDDLVMGPASAQSLRQ